MWLIYLKIAVIDKQY